MNPDEYAAQQAAISAGILNYVRMFGKFFTRPALTPREWLGLLQMIFPEVQRQREASAALAREFYDAQRRLHHPELPQQDRLLEGTDFPKFVKSMEPARARLSQADSPAHAVTQLGLQTVREVENAGRRQIIHSVEDDQAVADKQASSGPKVLRGWARVATGRETCAWCLMLVSRGPVYLGADTAGLDLNDTAAQQMIAAGEDVSGLMNQWHPGCDCIVVPVYKQEDWPGSAAQKRAEQLWKDASKEADSLIESGDSRTTNRNREALNALRRRIDSGDISPSEWSALSAAA